MRSYALEVQTAPCRSSEWTANALRFATPAEAEAYGCDLASRWTAVVETRVSERAEPITHTWVDGEGLAPVGAEHERRMPPRRVSL